jgi:hypothetical protein
LNPRWCYPFCCRVTFSPFYYYDYSTFKFHMIPSSKKRHDSLGNKIVC